MRTPLSGSSAEVISDLETLRELIARLNETDHWKPVNRPEQVTVEDVAEALQLDPNFVAAELHAIYEEHRDARLAGVLRELEEPLYRVERTANQDLSPLDSPLFKLRSVKILSERNAKKIELPRREKVEDDRLAKAMSYVILGILAMCMVFALAQLAIGIASRH